MVRFWLCVLIRLGVIGSVVAALAPNRLAERPMTAVTVFAQPQDVRSRIQDVLRYTGVANAPPVDLARMAELWMRAQDPGLAVGERRLVFRELLAIYAKLHGRDVSAHPEALDFFAQFAVTLFEGGGRMDLTLPEPRAKPIGTYLHVDTQGRGPTPLLLISDLGTDGRKVYASFAGRQAAAYTMHIVTLPYSGAARPLPWPETLDYTARPWVNAIERELLALIDQPRMRGITVVGTSAGGYFAARLALLRPKQIRAAVLVNVLVSTSMRSQHDPDAPVLLSERLLRVKSAPPAPQLFPVAPLPAPDELRRLIADPKSMHPTGRNWMAFAVKDPAVSTAWTFDALSSGFLVPSLEYTQELTSTDLTEQMNDLAVPMLAIGSWHDEGSPLTSFPAVSQWEEIKLRYPKVPLTVAVVENTRHYISADAAEEFDRALADFIGGRSVHVKTRGIVPRSSPDASVMQSVAAAQVERTDASGARVRTKPPDLP